LFRNIPFGGERLRICQILHRHKRITGTAAGNPGKTIPFSYKYLKNPIRYITMTTTETFTGITGILRPFREYLQNLHLQPGDQVVYYGCVGTCTPFVELLAIAVRGLHYEQVFVPLLEEAKAKKLHEVAGAGMQVSSEPAVLRPNVIVIMGGLAMPSMPVTKEQVRGLAARHRGATLVGVCFQDMFEKAGWLDTVEFDLLVNATLDPVTVTKRQ
jgi:hypothetical protein